MLVAVEFRQKRFKYNQVNVKSLNPDKYFLSPCKVLIEILHPALNDTLNEHRAVDSFLLLFQ